MTENVEKLSYYERNKEKIKEKKKRLQYEKNKEKNRVKSRQYYENNKEKRQEYQRNRYQNLSIDQKKKKKIKRIQKTMVSKIR